MKKLIITALCTVMAAGSVFADEYVWVDGLRYSLRAASYAPEPGVLQCTLQSPVESGFPNGDELQGEIAVPAFITYNGQKYAVTMIGREAFADQSQVTAVDIPSTVTEISTSAFRRCGISSITIPADVNDIGIYAFMSCSQLKEMIMMCNVPPTAQPSSFQNITGSCKLLVPKGTLSAYKGADYWNAFATIEENPDSPVLPTSITIAGAPLNALTGKSFTLTATVLPDDATDKSVVWKSLNPEIATVTADGVVTVNAEGRFNIEAISNGDSRVSNMVSVLGIDANPTIDGISYRLDYNEAERRADAYVVRGNTDYAGDVVIPQSFVSSTRWTVKGIDANAFAFMPNVTSVGIPASLDTIGMNAFRNCSGLKRVNISDIAAWTRISFNDRQSNPVHIDGSELYLDGAPVTEASIDGTVVKPFVFNGCATLTTVRLAETIESIGLSAFQNCSALEAVNLPASLHTIDAGAFASTALKNVVIPDGVTMINNQTFQYCSKLETVEMGPDVSMIYLMAFEGCSAIKSITVKAVAPPTFFSANVPDMAFEDFPAEVYNTAELLVPEEAVDAYKGAYIWRNFTNVKGLGAEHGESVVIDGIAYELFADKGTATVAVNADATGEIAIPATVEYEAKSYNVTALAKRAFAGTAIDIVRLPNGILHIADEAFADCASLICVGLPDDLQSVGVKAFYGSPKIRYMRSYNFGTGADHVPPVFDTYDGDPTGYGEAFSTDIWPDCLLCIPSSMYGNYKKQAGWKNFRSFGYWHADDVEPTEVSLDGSCYIGRVGEKLRLYPAFAPANATILKWTLNVGDPEVVNVTAATDEENRPCYEVELLKEGKCTLSLYGNLVKGVAEITVDNSYDGIDSIGTDDEATVRYFNLQGVETANPTPGIYVKVSAGKATKVVIK